MSDGDLSKKVTGPASYFPSIEKSYGRPVEEWKQLIRESPLDKHLELVQWLKTDYGLGHGHANALVAHSLAEGRCGTEVTRVQPAERPRVVPLLAAWSPPSLSRSGCCSASRSASSPG